MAMIHVRRLLGATGLAALAAAATVACAAPERPTAEQSARLTETEVSASVIGGAVEIHNGSNRRVFYRVVDPSFLGLWGTCTDPGLAGCHSVAPGATVRVPRDQIFGVAQSTRDVTVYWWDSNVDASSAEPSKAIREIPLKL